MLRWLLQRLAYPVLTLGSVAGVAFAIERHWSLVLTGSVITWTGMPLIIWLERRVPYAESWAPFAEDERSDIWHAALSERFYDLGGLASLFFFQPVGQWARAHGLCPWPDSAPRWAQVILALLLSDLSLYWAHRLAHTVPFLWKLHEVHHTSPRLHWLSVWRSHPLDNVLRSLANMAPLALVGVPMEVVALMAAFAGMSVLITHCNADLRTGPLDLVLSTPTVHRWHHVPGEALYTNYAPVLALWDHVFGSRRLPRERPTEAVGLPGPSDYRSQMRTPFLPASEPAIEIRN
jgi:sterol desaturase/sphingolipid hydroxylase (fatty acid hydroxylase superfamily)